MYKNVYKIAGMIKRPENGSLSLDNKCMGDSEKHYMDVICIKMCNRMFGKDLWYWK